MLLTEASGCAHPCLAEGNDGYAGLQQQNKIGVGYSAFMQGMLQAFFTFRLEIFGCIFKYYEGPPKNGLGWIECK